MAKPVPVEELDSADFEYVVEETPPRRVRTAGLRNQSPGSRMGWYVRFLLVLMALACATVLGVALWLKPYDEDGQPLTMASHTQLGMPPCNMVVMTGKPCPACGMTTSFSLLAHGDVLASLRANWVGTLMAAFTWSLIPYGILCAVKGRMVGLRNPEFALTILLSGLLVLMVGRWLWIMIA